MVLDQKSHRAEHSKIVLLPWYQRTNVNPKNPLVEIRHATA